MQYTNKVDIQLPRDRVVELFDNPDNLKHWMPGLISFDVISGSPGQSGTVSMLKFQMGKRMMEMKETITSRNLPDGMTALYEARGVRNEIKATFIALDPGSTRYISETSFRFSGIMKIFGFLMKGAFVKTSQGYLERFKKFAEEQG